MIEFGVIDPGMALLAGGVPEPDVVIAATLRVLGLGLLAGTVAAVFAVVFRWYALQEIPEGVAILLGLSAVAIWLNTTAALGIAIGGTDLHLELWPATFTLASFAVGTVGADLGRRLGDQLAADFTITAPIPLLDRDVEQLVRAKGRVLRVTLPEEIVDIEGYDPVSLETRDALAGTTMLFPRRITISELRDRLIDRLVADYHVGQVDVEVADDGTIEYLAVGGRATGLGPTLAPGTVAVAIRADPAFSASPGDLIQIWRDGDPPTLVVRGEFRAGIEDVATVTIDASSVEALDSEAGYRLVTLPAERGADKEFAALFRSAAETMSAITVTEGSDLAGQPATAVAATVAAIRRDDDVETLPTHERLLDPGDTLYVIGRPEMLRRIKAAAEGDSGGETPDASVTIGRG